MGGGGVLELESGGSICGFELLFVEILMGKE
jgi:hypothetical protein